MKRTEKESVAYRGLRRARAVIATGMVLALLAPSGISADWSMPSFGDIAKVVKKVGKKVVLPASIVFHGVANAAEATARGDTAAEIVGAGIGGVAKKIGESIEETMDDIETIGKAAVKVYREY